MVLKVIFRFEDCALDDARCELRRAGDLISVEPQVLSVLLCLLRHRDRIVSRDDLIGEVWDGRIVSESTLSSRVAAVRHAIGDSGERQHLIRTLPRKGYRFIGAVREEFADGAERDHFPQQLPRDKPSIAVLPFANLSGNPENAYFAAGVQDEIITRLAKIGQLKVVSCLTTQRFKSAPDDLPAIAKQLGVANLLQGSVQRSADAVRVNVQLVSAEPETRLWADTFDRKLTDVFQIESDIAKTIADKLQAKLSGSEQRAISIEPTADLEAHELYLQGRYLWNRRTVQNLKKALAYFEEAAAKDPNYALA